MPALNRRDFLKTIGAGSLSLCMGSLQYCSLSKETNPNIIYINIDDLGWKDLYSGISLSILREEILKRVILFSGHGLVRLFDWENGNYMNTLRMEVLNSTISKRTSVKPLI